MVNLSISYHCSFISPCLSSLSAGTPRIFPIKWMMTRQDWNLNSVRILQLYRRYFLASCPDSWLIFHLLWFTSAPRGDKYSDLQKKKKKKGTPGTEITQWASGSTAQWSVNSDHSLTVTFHVVSKWSKRHWHAIWRYVASSLHALIALILSVFKIVSSLQRSHGAQHLVMYLTLTSTCLRLQSSPGEMLFLSCSDFSVTVASSRQAVRKNCMFAYRLLHPWLLDMQSKQRRCRGRPRRTMQPPRVSVSGAGRKWSPSQT